MEVILEITPGYRKAIRPSGWGFEVEYQKQDPDTFRWASTGDPIPLTEDSEEVTFYQEVHKNMYPSR